MIAAIVVLVVSTVTARASADAPPSGTVPEQPPHVVAMARLARADQMLRHGRPRAAQRLFLQVFETGQGTPWAGFAELGLAWTAVATGDLAAARDIGADALTAAGDATVPANVMIALLDGSQGRHAEAIRRLTGVINAQQVGSAAWNVARLARGYVQYWANSTGQATADFDAVAAADANGRLVDDAMYGSARTLLVNGERDAGEAALHAIVARAPAGARTGAVSDELIDLEPAAILRDSFKRYRKAGVQMPAAQLVNLLDADGVARARAALRRFVPEQPAVFVRGVALPRPDAVGVPKRSDAEGAVTVVAPVDNRVDGGAPDVAPASSTSDRFRMRAVLVVAVMAMLVLLALSAARLRHRRGPRP